MTVLPGNELAPDFNDPLGLLHACHQRMLGFCATLEKLPKHISLNGIDPDAKQAIQKIHRYFTTAAKLHHQDEEQDVFPLLAGQSQKLTGIIDGLKKEHQHLESAWKKIEPLLSKPSSIKENTEFKQQVNAFCELYRTHIQTEEQDILDIAQHLLSTDQLEKIGKSMQARRE